MLVKSVRTDRLHPNPDDEFCFPDVGPNYGIINAQRHLLEVQRDRAEMLPQKMPGRYRISLHIDDETIICTAGKLYGFNVYQLDADDDDWKEKIIARAEMIRKREQGGNG